MPGPPVPPEEPGDRPPSAEDPEPVEEAAADPPPVAAAAPETVGTGSYVAVSCVAAMGMLLVLLIVGLLISRWLS